MTQRQQPVSTFDFAGLNRAARLVLTSDIITATWPRRGALEAVLPWADLLEGQMRDLFGYRLIATAHHVRLIRALDLLDLSQRDPFMSVARKPRPFDQRRIAYLCLMLSVFQRSRTETDLVDLVGAFTPLAQQIDGLGYAGTVPAHKAAVADVIEWLIARGALRVSEGSVQSWVDNDREGDALFDIDHDVCSMLFRPERPLQYIDSIHALLQHIPEGTGPERAEAIRRRARRLLLELPVVYYGQVDPETAEAMQSRDLAHEIRLLTGLQPEYAAEGVMLTDPGGYFTDERFPHRPSAVNRAAGLLASVVAQQVCDAEADFSWMPVVTLREENSELATRADDCLESMKGRQVPQSQQPATLQAPFIPVTHLGTVLAHLYTDLGASSFGTWSTNPEGLLRVVVPRLAELGLAQLSPGGLLLLPLAARYRKIIDVARDARDQQLSFDYTEDPSQ